MFTPVADIGTVMNLGHQVAYMFDYAGETVETQKGAPY